MIDSKDEKDGKRPVESAEEPIVMIERIPDNPQKEEREEVVVLKRSHLPKWGVALAVAILLLLALIIFLLVRRKDGDAKNGTSVDSTTVVNLPHAEKSEQELPISTTAEESTERLQATVNEVETTPPGVTMTEDVINDVRFRLYTINGLKAELSFEEPSIDDEEVYLYSHSADVRADNGKIVCACVVRGEQISEGNNRSGYFASVGDNMVIGVAYNDSVLNYARENGGYFFRQFALVSDGQIGDIRLKGKSRRSALGYKEGQLIYVESVNPESLYDFAEALCDYGFTDALYITGGKVYSYYRDQAGKRHNMGIDKEPKSRILNSALPFLVFRKK